MFPHVWGWDFVKKILNYLLFSLMRESGTKEAFQFCKNSIFGWENWPTPLLPNILVPNEWSFCYKCKFYHLIDKDFGLIPNIIVGCKIWNNCRKNPRWFFCLYWKLQDLRRGSISSLFVLGCLVMFCFTIMGI